METSNKKAVAWLSSAHLVNDIYSGFLNPIMPFLAAKLGFTMAIATVIISIAHICSSLLQPFFGFIADNILKRVFIFWGLLFGSLFVPMTPLAPNVYILTLFVMLGNIGGSFFHPQATGFIIRFSGNNYSENMGYFISAGSIGFSFGPIIAGMVAQYFGLHVIPYTCAFGVILALLMFNFVPRLTGHETLPVQKKFRQTFKTILSNKNIIILIIISMMKSLITNSSCILLPFLWKDMHYSPAHIGTILFLFIFFGGIASLCSEKIEAAIGAKKVFYISMCTTFPLMLLFVMNVRTNPSLAVGIFVLMGFITMLAMPVTMVMAQRILPEYKSIIAGFINGFSWGVSAICLTLVGFSAQKFGITHALVVISLVPAVCSYLVKYLPDNS